MRPNMPKTTLHLGLGLLLGLSLPACSDGGNSSDNNTGDGGNGSGSGSANANSGGGEPTCDVDFSRLDGADPVSFRSDVMPIFGLSCNTSQCHDADRPKAQMYLGPRCKYNADSGECVFNQEGQPPQDGLDMEDPLTDMVVQQILSNIVSAASATAPALNRIEPGDPGNSFLIDKIADRQDDLSVDCTPQDPTAVGQCGSPMPPPSATLCLQKNGQGRFDTIATWVLQGAADN